MTSCQDENVFPQPDLLAIDAIDSDRGITKLELCAFMAMQGILSNPQTDVTDAEFVSVKATFVAKRVIDRLNDIDQIQ